MIGKCLRKIIAIIILYIKEKEIFPAYISDINLNWEKHNLFMIPNEQKEGWYVLAVKNYLQYYIEYCQIIKLIFIVWIVFILLEQK